MTLRYFSVRVPTRPSFHVSAAQTSAVSILMGSSNDEPERTCPTRGGVTSTTQLPACRTPSPAPPSGSKNRCASNDDAALLRQDSARAARKAGAAGKSRPKAGSIKPWCALGAAIAACASRGGKMRPPPGFSEPSFQSASSAPSMRHWRASSGELCRYLTALSGGARVRWL